MHHLSVSRNNDSFYPNGRTRIFDLDTVVYIYWFFDFYKKYIFNYNAFSYLCNFYLQVFYKSNSISNYAHWFIYCGR